MLLNKTELKKLERKLKDKGLTVIASKLFINEKNLAKLKIHLARGKKLHDKRQTDKDRSWSRDKARLMRDKG